MVIRRPRKIQRLEEFLFMQRLRCSLKSYSSRVNSKLKRTWTAKIFLHKLKNSFTSWEQAGTCTGPGRHWQTNILIVGSRQSLFSRVCWSGKEITTHLCSLFPHGSFSSRSSFLNHLTPHGHHPTGCPYTRRADKWSCNRSSQSKEQPPSPSWCAVTTHTRVWEEFCKSLSMAQWNLQTSTIKVAVPFWGHH